MFFSGLFLLCFLNAFVKTLHSAGFAEMLVQSSA